MSNLGLMAMKEVGKRIEALRHAHNIGSQAHMAWLLGVKVGAYGHWTTGKALIPVWAAIKLCRLTGATTDYIYRGDLSGLPLRLTTLLSQAENESNDCSATG